MYTASGSSCSNGLIDKYRINYTVLPVESTIVIPLVTGIGFGPGKVACLYFDKYQAWATVRGYYFNPK